MGIRKTFITYITTLLLPLNLLNCGDQPVTPSFTNVKESAETASLKNENTKLKDHIKFQDAQFNNWLNTFSEIQDEFLSIETEGLYTMEALSDEGFAYKQDYISELKNKANHIRWLLNKKDKELSEYDDNYKGLKSILSNYRAKLNYAAKRIDNLERDNKQLEIKNSSLINENEKLNVDLDLERETNKDLEHNIEVINLKLNERYLIEIATMESKISKISDLQIHLGYKFHKYELLTTHPPNSYSLYNLNDKAVLIIEDEKRFWAYSQFLVLKVKKRKLK